MKRFYGDSAVARFLLKHSRCHTITLGPFIFSKYAENVMPQSLRNHETCHSIQWSEVTISSWIVLSIIQIILGKVLWWFPFIALAIYYVWYGLEYAIRLVMYRNMHQAYKGVSFEREARCSERDNNYIENRELFESWKRFLLVK